MTLAGTEPGLADALISARPFSCLALAEWRSFGGAGAPSSAFRFR